MLHQGPGGVDVFEFITSEHFQCLVLVSPLDGSRPRMRYTRNLYDWPKIDAGMSAFHPSVPIIVSCGPKPVQRQLAEREFRESLPISASRGRLEVHGPDSKVWKQLEFHSHSMRRFRW